jgi:lysophospholipase L1-like esterase
VRTTRAGYVCMSARMSAENVTLTGDLCNTDLCNSLVIVSLGKKNCDKNLWNSIGGLLSPTRKNSSRSPAAAHWTRACGIGERAMALTSAATIATIATAPIRILAFGDSVTAGWTSFSSGPTSPFAPHLENALQAAGFQHVQVQASGEAGLAASHALPKLKRALSHKKFDVCLIYLGANDLLGEMARGGAPSIHAVNGVLEHLSSLHATCRHSGALTIALGFLKHPLIASLDGGSAVLKQINARIEEEADADAFIDGLPLLSASISDLWSSDRVHCTAHGYETLGENLSTPLVRILQKLRPDALAGGASHHQVA